MVEEIELQAIRNQLFRNESLFTPSRSAEVFRCLLQLGFKVGSSPS
jgi:hypothetical protein